MPFSYPLYVGTLRPHLGHKLTWQEINGQTALHCLDCNADLKDSTPLVPEHLDFVKHHIGHTMTCEEVSTEVDAHCQCGMTVISSVPF